MENIIVTFVKSTACGFLLAFGLAMSAQASVIADFQVDYVFTHEDGKTRVEASADGWDYMWNENGAIGTATNYASLVQDDDWWSDPYCATATFPCPWPAYVLNIGPTGGHPGAGTGQGYDPEYFAITAYTVQAGEAGLVSITDSSFGVGSVDSNGVDFRVYVNDTLKTSFVQAGGAAASGFDAALGYLNVGDTVYVAAGPNGNLNNDSFTLSYKLESSPVPEWSMGEPMVFYWSVPAATDANFQQAVDGGYNMFWHWDNPNVPVADLARMEQYDLRPFIRSEGLLSPSAGALDDPVKLAQLNALIDTYKECPNAYAYFITDEPNAADFPYIARMVAHIRARDPNHLAYVNLLGSASPEQLGVADFETYINQYVSTVHPQVLSYDYYGLTVAGDGNRHLGNLGVVANAAKNAGIPFVNLVQNCAWGSWLRKPTADEMRFLTTSTLAYGAAGIGYFNYYTDDPAGGGVYDKVAEMTTDVYDWVTSLNEEFKNVATQYQGLEWLGTYLRGYSTLPPGTTQLAMTGVPFNVNLSNTMTYTDGDPLEGLLFGFFDTDGTSMGDATFAYIANLDYSTGVSYILTGPGDLSVFDASTGVWTAMGSDQITLNLEAGGGRLVGLTSLISDIPGDANYDHKVDATDAAILAENWLYGVDGLNQATWAMGDFNGDHKVDDIDATILAANWHTSVSVSVPEPSAAFGLLCLAFVMLAAIHRQ